MKKLIIVCSLIWSSISYTQDFTITPTSRKINLKNIPENTKIIFPEKNSKKYLSSKKRDQIFSKYIKSEIQGLDEVDRDILYKSILNYKETDVLEKYPFITKEKLESLKNDFN